MEAMERLRSEVREMDSAVDSAITTLNGLSAALRQAMMKDDTDEMRAEIEELVNTMDRNNDRLAQAIAANTEAADDSADSVDDEMEIDAATPDAEEPIPAEMNERHPNPINEPPANVEDGEAEQDEDSVEPTAEPESPAPNPFAQGDNADSETDKAG